MKATNKFKTLVLIAGLLLTGTAFAQIGAWDPKLEVKAEEAISELKWKNLDMEHYFNESYGYVVFPSIGKGGIVIGGAHGRGLVYEQGSIIGEAKMTQVSVGFQWGGQAYSEVIFFKDQEAMEAFQRSELELAGQASAVALKSGASADLAYDNGVAVYTIAKGGLMYEAALGGQKFKYFPLQEVSEEGDEQME